eukprot:scaffold15405_cov119-Isochrysis_galbana.AAC.4
MHRASTGYRGRGGGWSEVGGWGGGSSHIARARRVPSKGVRVPHRLRPHCHMCLASPRHP